MTQLRVMLTFSFCQTCEIYPTGFVSDEVGKDHTTGSVPSRANFTRTGISDGEWVKITSTAQRGPAGFYPDGHFRPRMGKNHAYSAVPTLGICRR